MFLVSPKFEPNFLVTIWSHKSLVTKIKGDQISDKKTNGKMVVNSVIEVIENSNHRI